VAGTNDGFFLPKARRLSSAFSLRLFFGLSSLFARISPPPLFESQQSCPPSPLLFRSTVLTTFPGVDAPTSNLPFFPRYSIVRSTLRQSRFISCTAKFPSLVASPTFPAPVGISLHVTGFFFCGVLFEGFLSGAPAATITAYGHTEAVIPLVVTFPPFSLHYLVCPYGGGSSCVSEGRAYFFRLLNFFGRSAR